MNVEKVCVVGIGVFKVLRFLIITQISSDDFRSGFEERL